MGTSQEEPVEANIVSVWPNILSTTAKNFRFREQCSLPFEIHQFTRRLAKAMMLCSSPTSVHIFLWFGPSVKGRKAIQTVMQTFL